MPISSKFAPFNKKKSHGVFRGYPFRVPFVGALDGAATNLAGAWSSSRRLLTSWEGNLIRLLRSSDSEEVDIGADVNGNLDTTALSAFAGSSDFSVVRVYDQSGSGIHFEAAAAANAPKMGTGGVLSTNSGKPAFQFIDTSSQYLQTNANLQVTHWLTTSRVSSPGDYRGLITGSAVNGGSIVMIGDVGSSNAIAPGMANAVYRVDGVDKTVELTPFGFDTHCFTVTGDATTRTWLWGAERLLETRFNYGFGHEAIFYNGPPTSLSATETILKEWVGL